MYNKKQNFKIGCITIGCMVVFCMLLIFLSFSCALYTKSTRLKGFCYTQADNNVTCFKNKIECKEAEKNLSDDVPWNSLKYQCVMTYKEKVHGNL